MTDIDPCRVMAEQLITGFGHTRNTDQWNKLVEVYEIAIRDYTALPDLVEGLTGCIKWMEPVMDGFRLPADAESRELLVAGKAALAKAEGRRE